MIKDCKDSKTNSTPLQVRNLSKGVNSMYDNTNGNDAVRCSFAGRRKEEVKKIVAGPGVYICNECIDLCKEIIDEEVLRRSHS